MSQLLTQSRWDQHGYDDIERQGNELTLIRRQIKTAPEYNPEQHRPIAYPQRAKVVGPEGETIHVDEWGALRCVFYLLVVMIMGMMVARVAMTMIPTQLGWMY